MTVRHEHPADETRTAVKNADQLVNNSDVLEDCDDLKLEVGANEVWGFNASLFVNSSAVADLKLGWTVPASATMKWNTNQTTAAVTSESGTLGVSCSGSDQVCHLKGVIVADATPGTVQLQFAQNTAEVSDTKILANSHIIFTKLK